MNKSLLFFISIVSVLFFVDVAHASDFKVKAKGVQVFNFADRAGRNQVIFFSKAPIEDITGTANGISGTLSFDPANVARTISGAITVQVRSMTTGIEKRDEHMYGETWLDEAKYPRITFELSEFKNLKSISATQVTGMAVGDFTLHGVTRKITTPSTLVYMEESEKTKARAPGDLLQIRVKFSFRLSDYGIKGYGDLIGNKVGDTIDIEMSIVGSNAGG